VPALFGCLTILACLVAGVIIIATGHIFIGIIVAGASIPAGLIVWVTRD
jgi:hypothetical protein